MPPATPAVRSRARATEAATVTWVQSTAARGAKYGRSPTDQLASCQAKAAASAVRHRGGDPSQVIHARAMT